MAERVDFRVFTTPLKSVIHLWLLFLIYFSFQFKGEKGGAPNLLASVFIEFALSQICGSLLGIADSLLGISDSLSTFPAGPPKQYSLSISKPNTSICLSQFGNCVGGRHSHKNNGVKQPLVHTLRELFYHMYQS